MIPHYPPFQRGRRLLFGGLAAFVAGAAATVAGFALEPRQAYFSYLTAASFVVSIALGALVFLMIIHATGAKWPVVMRRLAESIAGTLPLYALLFIPILFGLRSLYSWTDPSRLDAHARLLVSKKLSYLNSHFFIARAAFYFGVWIFVSVLLRRLSLRQDSAATPARAGMTRLAGFGLPAVGLTLSFAAFDWMMSLEPTWYSTIFGIYWFAGGFESALALLTIVVFAAERSGALPGITRHHYSALGRMLLAFVVFWAYIAFFQYLIIWIADKPVEVTWYLVRTRGGWAPVTLFLILGHFFVPFFALLSYRAKRSGPWLAAVSVWLLLCHYVDIHWLIIPTLHPERFVLHWLDAGALFAFAGLGLVFGVWLLRGRAPVPIADPLLADSLGYHSP